MGIDLKSVGSFLASGLLLAACGGGSAASAPPAAGSGGAPSTPAQIATYQASDRQQVLEAGAKKEGTMTWYTSLAGDVVDNLANGFKQKYGVQVDVFRAAEDQLTTKATQEAQAGKQVFDVLESPPAAGAILGDSKILTPFYSPGLANVPKDQQRKPSGSTAEAAAVRMTLVGFGYNTTLIPDNVVPKTLEDLMNPALTGKLSLAGTTTGYKWVGSVLKKMGDEPGKKWLQQFAAQQKPQVQQISGKAVEDLIAKGEVPASPTIFRDHVELSADKNAPVKWAPLEPVVANVGEVNLAAKAPHPYAAVLFIDWMLSDGQKILKADHYSLPTEKPAFTIWVPEEGRTAAQDEKDLNGWADLFKTTFR
jgi:iron(III) transport system substrate-binding protein